MKNTAKVSSIIDAPVAKVWDALVNPAVIKKYMMGADVISDFKVGSSIIWKGEYQGKPYEDKGKILTFEPSHQLSYNHASGSAPDRIHTVTVTLVAQGKKTKLELTQDNNADQNAQKDAEKNWKMMLDGMRKLVEKPAEQSAHAPHS